MPPEQGTTQLDVMDLQKAFNGTRALQGVSFDLADGAIGALLGPSGSGKSTLLSIIAGLEQADHGRVLWAGEDIAGVPVHERRFGLMFQNYMLFPHMNVYHNVAFGLKMAGLPEDKARERVAEMLDLVGLGGFESRDVNTLSGGEQQRVALARSLAPRPRLLMLDEPLSSLDRTLRERLMEDLRDILHALQQTALYVTHDQEQAFAIADEIVLLREGRVVQSGPPQRIYQQPASTFVARFLGMENLIPGEITSLAGETVLRWPFGEVQLDTDQRGPVTALLRPDSARLDGNGIPLKGYVRARTFRGSVCRLDIDVNGCALSFDFSSSQEPLPAPGAPCTLTILPERIQLLP